MHRYAIIDTRSNVVANVIEYSEAPSNPPPGFDEHFSAVLADGTGCSPGWSWTGNDLVDPAPVEWVSPVPAIVSDRQFFHALALMGTITQAEALAAVKTGDIPAALAVFVESLPEDQRFDAEMLISGATTFERAHPMTAVLAAGMGWTDAQVDDLWRAAATL